MDSYDDWAAPMVRRRPLHIDANPNQPFLKHDARLQVGRGRAHCVLGTAV
jgi:hypothetical protein